METNPGRTIDVLFGIVLLLVALLSIPWHEGIALCDPLFYVLAAKKFVETHSIDYNSLFETRVTAWLPYAVYILFFGINEHLTWVTLITFLILLCVIYFLLRKHHQVVAFYMVALLGLSPFMIQTATAIMGEIPLMLFANLPLLIYWRFVLAENSNLPGRWGLVAAVCWVTAFFAKEVAVYFLLAGLFFTVISFLKKAQLEIKFWKSFWLVLIIAGVLCAVYFYFQTGDPFRKITLSKETVAHFDKSSSERIWDTSWELLGRLTYQPILFFIQYYTMGIMIMLSLVFLAAPVNTHDRFWKHYLMILLLIWWIFPQSINPYHPMWLLHRLWTPLLLPLSVCAGCGLKILLTRQETKAGKWLVIISGISFALISWLLFENQHDMQQRERAFFYAIVTSCLLIVIHIRENEILPDRKLAWIVAIAPFLYVHANRFSWVNFKSEYEYMKELITNLENRGDARMVITTYCLAQFYKLYDSDKLKMVSYDSGDFNRNDDFRNAYLVLDRNLLDIKYTSKEDDDFTELTTIEYSLEKNPVQFGFTLVEENEKFQIYRHE